MSAAQVINDLQVAEVETRAPVQKWRIIPVSKLPTLESQKLAMKLNALGSCFYFGKVILRRHRLNDTLHKDMCESVEKTLIKDVIELPRDHFKSTVFSEIVPMWWALPFTDTEEMAMRKLGYDDAYITWMKRAHDRNTRTLLVSEVITNAVKLGTRISHHYLNNDLFRDIFPEISPDRSCTWTANSLHHKRDKTSPNGEGTYDFLGVGGALQSRHYDRVVQDDLVGRAAIDSDATMEDTINYHRLLPGAFDSLPGKPTEENDELVVGNRWSNKDLNAWIRKEEPWFNFQTHAVMGGCCVKHIAGEPIFPQEWSEEKLVKTRIRFGNKYFSSQFLNNPVSDEEKEFDKRWLRYYNLQPLAQTDRRAVIKHEVQEGEVVPDLPLFSDQGRGHDMIVTMTVDPNHAGNNGRCRHAITVTGYIRSPQRIYLLDSFAKSCDYHTFVAQIYAMAKKWHLREFWLETVMAQRYLKFYLEYRNKQENIHLKVNDLKADNSANAKDNRIRAMNPIFAEGQFWCERVKHADFIQEYEDFPSGYTKDILDTLAYAPQTWNRSSSNKEVLEFLAANKSRAKRAVNSITGY